LNNASVQTGKEEKPISTQIKNALLIGVIQPRNQLQMLCKILMLVSFL
jgi:hypothetical protein